MGPGSSCIFYSQICILPLFPGTLSSNYRIYICVEKLQKNFNMKDSEHFCKCNFPFLYLRQSRVLFVHLLLFADTLLCKLGVWGLLRAPEAVILLSVKYAFSHFSWYFFFKNLAYIYVGTYTEYLYFSIKLLGILTNLFFKIYIGLVCRYISL